jgi:hypothetical protein
VGCTGGTLSWREWTFYTAFAIAAAALPGCGETTSTEMGGSASAPKASDSLDERLTEEDRAILNQLDLFSDWELLRDWDPEEDLPIPLDGPDRAHLPEQGS